MLQSEESRPALFYSWGGGVMEAQAKAGFLRDIKARGRRHRQDAVADRGRRLHRRRQGLRLAVRHRRGADLLQQGAVRQGRRQPRRHAELGRLPRRRQEAEGRRHHADRRRRRREMADALLVLLSRHADRRLACARRRQGRQGRRLQERRPSSKPASGCRSWRRWSRSSRATPPPRIAQSAARLRRRQGGDGPDGQLAARHAGANSPRTARAWRRPTSA